MKISIYIYIERERERKRERERERERERNANKKSFCLKSCYGRANLKNIIMNTRSTLLEVSCVGHNHQTDIWEKK